MKLILIKIVKIYSLIVWFILTSCQENHFTESDQEQVIKIIKELEKGVSEGNNESWKKYMAEDAVLINRDGKSYNKSEIVEEFKPLPSGKILKVEPKNIKIYNNSGHSATVSFIADEKLSIWGQVVDTQYPSVMYFEKRKGKWLMILFTYYEKPVNPPPVKMNKEDLCKYIGTYAVSDSLQIKIGANDTALFIIGKGGKSPGTLLYPISVDGRFFRKDSESEYIFVKDSNGNNMLKQRRNWIDLIWTKK